MRPVGPFSLRQKVAKEGNRIDTGPDKYHIYFTNTAKTGWSGGGAQVRSCTVISSPLPTLRIQSGSASKSTGSKK